MKSANPKSYGLENHRLVLITLPSKLVTEISNVVNTLNDTDSDLLLWVAPKSLLSMLYCFTYKEVLWAGLDKILQHRPPNDPHDEIQNDSADLETI